jgi:hypothetical protein
MQKRKPVRLKKIRDAANGEDCTINSPWCLNGRDCNETVVLAHYGEPDEKGTALKPDDTSAAFACAQCHDWLDGRYQPKKGDHPWADKEWYWFRGMRRTWRRLIEKSILK